MHLHREPSVLELDAKAFSTVALKARGVPIITYRMPDARMARCKWVEAVLKTSGSVEYLALDEAPYQSDTCIT